MTLASALLVATLAAAPSPRAWKDAETVVHLPSLEAAKPVVEWLEKAGAKAVLLRPSSWRTDFHPLLVLDPTSADSLSAAGISASGPFTLSIGRTARIACTTLSDPAKFEASVAARFAGAGELKRSAKKGVTQVTLERGETTSAGYALKGNQACAFLSETDAPKLPAEMVALVGREPRPAAALGAVKGLLYVQSSRGPLALDAEGDTLVMRATSRQLPMPALLGGGATPYSQPSGDSLLTVRTRLPTSANGVVVDSLERTLRRVCSACEASVLGSVAEAIAPHLTGHALFHASRVQVRDSLKTFPGQYAAVKHAVLAETKQPEKVRAALARLATLKGGSREEEGVSLAVRGGTLRFGVSGKHVFVANDGETLTQALAAVKPDQLAHGASFRLDPKLASRGLTQISVLDAFGGTREAQLIAGLMAVSLELGPLLAASQSIDGWIDSAPAGGHRIEVRWRLAP